MTNIPDYLLSDNSTVDEKGELVIGGCDVQGLVEEFGTPLFVYDEDHIRARCKEAVDGFGSHATYASKAFLCRYLAKLVSEEGMGIDVATGGELSIVLAAGVDPSTITMHGNNKSQSELEHALASGVGKIVIDSFDEIELLERIHNQGLHPVPNVLIRVTPGVKAETHKFISTGQDDSKFGLTVSTGDAQVAIEKAKASPAMNLIGIHCHIGSQVFLAESFARALEVMAQIAQGQEFEEIVIGGGIGVPYTQGEPSPTITEWVEALKAKIAELGLTAKIGIEPGRSIVAAAATTIYTVGTVKTIPGIRTYVAVDGGMSENPRPIMYDSGYEAFNPLDARGERSMEARVVGKHCETGDIIIENAKVDAGVKVGDLLATPVTGAYGHCMASNYNGVGRPAVVFVANGEARLVKRRETVEDLLATDIF